MAAIDFPNNPTANQIFTAPNGVVWLWDGTKWKAAGGGGTYLPLAGGLLTGAIGGPGSGGAVLSANDPLANDSSKALATTEWITNAFAPIASPTFTGLLTPGAQGIKGVTDGSNAPAGCVGEVQSLSTSSVAISNQNVSTAILTLPLTAGDWDVEGWVGFTSLGNGIVNAQAAVNTAVNTAPGNSGGTSVVAVSGNVANGTILATGVRRFNSNAAQTAYLVAWIGGTYTAGTTANGMIRARRMR